MQVYPARIEMQTRGQNRAVMEECSEGGNMNSQRIPVMKKEAGALRAVLCLLLCVSMMLPAAGEPVYAAENTPVVTFSQLNDPSVFLKQSQPHVCTLTASAMMLRRAAMLLGNDDWEEITESSVRSAAWVEGTGIRWSFSSAGFSVVHKYISSTSELIKLLGKHPEGIVAYNPRKPHAVLLTDYTDGVFYCSDPSNGSPSGRYPVSKSSITVESVSRVWYVRSPDNLTVFRDDQTYKVDKLQYRIIDTEELMVQCIGMTGNSTSVVIPDAVEIEDKTYRVTSVADQAFKGKNKLKRVVIGACVTEIGTEAFADCKKLSSVRIMTIKLQLVGVDAFGNINKKAEILVGNDQVEEYTALFALAVPKSVVIAADQPEI